MQQTLEGDNAIESNPKLKSTKADEMAQKQRDIGIAEFFAKNRHLLGFDNKKKGLLTTVKEAVDNSLDACEEANIMPEISIELIDMGNERIRVIIEDNGPGIVKKQIPNIFGKLLYGSKFHRLKQSRGQQGIGISAAVLYAQLTTGRSAKIISRISADHPSLYYELKIDTQTNNPQIITERETEFANDHGTRIEIDIEAVYAGGAQSVDEYLKQTAITNPHATFIYTTPKADQYIFARVTDRLPVESQEIKPHPDGVELGVLMNMLAGTESKTLQQFLTLEFCKVGPGTAKQICENSALLPTTKPKSMTREMSEHLLNGIKKSKLMGPPTDCLSPITSPELEKGLKKEVNAEFYTAVTRSPSVYRGNPFIIEVGLAYGGDQKGDGQAKVVRYANRVPLLYQQGACAVTKAVVQTAWRNYGFSQSKGALPIGPLTIAVHIASVWVPFTSESKEAVAHYPEIIKEVKLALQDAGRKLGMYVKKKKRILEEGKKRGYIEKYIPHVAVALKDILDLNESQREEVEEKLSKVLERKRGKLEDMDFDPSKNEEYDEDFAKIGSYDETPEEDD